MNLKIIVKISNGFTLICVCKSSPGHKSPLSSVILLASVRPLFRPDMATKAKKEL